MKKWLSVVLCVCLLLIPAMSVLALQPYETTFEDIDVDGDMYDEWTFETGTLMNRRSSGLYTWHIDDSHSLSFYPGSWSGGTVDNNPVKTATGAPGSVVNASDKAWYYATPSTQGWRTQGGNVLNIEEKDGTVRPLILENGVTYKLSFDYMVYRCHRTDTFTNSSGNSMHVNADEVDQGCVGYGYDLTSNSNYHPVTYPKTTLGYFFTYSENANGASGTSYTGASGTEQTGSWYHVEYTFTPSGMATFDFDSTPNITAGKNAPFLIFFRRSIAGAASYIDNIRITRPVETTLNPMGGTVAQETLTGFVGTAAEVPSATRYGYDFGGWYKDGACTVPYEGVITADLHRKELYAAWNTTIGFEGYKGLSGMNSNLSVSSDECYSGAKSMRYRYTYNWWNSGDRNGVTNAVAIKKVSNNTTYKISFRYKLTQGEVCMYPVTIGDSMSSASCRTYTDTAITTNSSENGKWMKGTMYLTTSFASGGDNLAIHVEATSAASATLYLDDVVVDLSAGYTSLTVNAGTGTIRGVASSTINAELGSHLLFDNMENGTAGVVGYYYNAALTEKCTAAIVTETLAGRTLYAKWGDSQGYEYAEPEQQVAEGYLPLSRQTQQAASGRYSAAFLRAASDSRPGMLTLGQADPSSTYLVCFRYYVPTNDDVTFAAATFNGNIGGAATLGAATTVAGKNDGWKEYAVLMYTPSATGRLMAGLSVAPSGARRSECYIDEVSFVKMEGTTRCVIFDTTAAGGNRTAAVGQSGSAIPFPGNKSLLGYTITGWYTNKTFTTAYTNTNFTTNTIVYAKTTARAETTVPGDCDGDGVLDTTDLVALKKYLSGQTAAVSAMADINGDGTVDVLDLLRLSKQLAGIA